MGNVKWKSAGYICNEIKLSWSLFVTKIQNRKNFKDVKREFE